MESDTVWSSDISYQPGDIVGFTKDETRVARMDAWEHKGRAVKGG
jgi:hypothetical protein